MRIYFGDGKISLHAYADVPIPEQEHPSSLPTMHAPLIHMRYQYRFSEAAVEEEENAAVPLLSVNLDDDVMYVYFCLCTLVYEFSYRSSVL